jgi:hypothetical protein
MRINLPLNYNRLQGTSGSVSKETSRIRRDSNESKSMDSALALMSALHNDTQPGLANRWRVIDRI